MKKHHYHLITFTAIWYSLPLIFLAQYVWTYAYPSYSIPSHLYVVTHYILIGILLKETITRIIKKENFSILLGSIIYATLMFIMLVYYSLVIIGLHSWRRVISKELILSYLEQAPQFCSALGISYPLIISLIVGIYLVFIGCAFFLIKKTRSIVYFPKSSARLINTLILCLLILISYRAYAHVLQDVKGSYEPVSFTLSEREPEVTYLRNPKLNILEYAEKTNYQTSSITNPKNLILIVVDALRPDHMGVYGYSRSTTPNLSEMERIGLLHKATNVHASCGESACGLSSIASSKFVHQLPDKPFTLQQVLKLHGYKVHMILGGDHTNFYNLKDIYGEVDSYFDGSNEKYHYINDDNFVIAKAKKLPEWDGQPYMMQFHLMSAHRLGLHKKEYEKYTPFKGYGMFTNEPPKMEFTNFYDNGVLQADSMINELLNTLKSKNYLENTLIVITADHGESLGEHNMYAHANSEREELLRIPLVFISYGDKSSLTKSYEQFASQVDIAPTILQEFKIAVPKTWYGNPIQLTNKADFTFFELAPYAGIYDHRDSKNLWKYWINTNTNQEVAFNLSIDPKEQNNLITEVPLELKTKWRATVKTRQSPIWQ